MAIQSQLTSIVATQVGKIQGELEARIVSQTFNILEEFKNECPDIDSLKTVIRTRNNLLKVVNNFQKIINKYQALSDSLNPAITAAKVLINLLRNDPTPIAVGAPPLKDFGGLISSKTAGQQNSSADKLRSVSLLLQALEDDQKSINNLIESINPTLSNVRNLLNTVNTRIQNCTEELTESANISTDIDLNTIQEFIKEIQPSNTVIQGQSAAEEFIYRSTKGTDYTLQVLTETQADFKVPRRYAIAKDITGVVVLRGQPSFSSDTQILLDELKFRIDNQLP